MCPVTDWFCQSWDLFSEVTVGNMGDQWTIRVFAPGIRWNRDTASLWGQKLREPKVNKDVVSISSPWHSSTTKRPWTEGEITVTQILSKYHITNHHINLYSNQPKLGLSKLLITWQSNSMKTFRSPKHPLNRIHDHCYKSPRLQGSNPQLNQRSNGV